MANGVDPEQTAPIGAGTVCSGSTPFASILNSSAILGNSLQQTTSADDIFRCIFYWRFKGNIVCGDTGMQSAVQIDAILLYYRCIMIETTFMEQ